MRSVLMNGFGKLRSVFADVLAQMFQHKYFLAFSHLVRCTSRPQVSSHGSGLFLHFTYATTRLPKNQWQVHDNHWYYNDGPGRILLVS